MVVFVKLGQSVMIEGNCSLQDAIDKGVRRAYTNPDNPLRASVITSSHRVIEKIPETTHRL